MLEADPAPEAQVFRQRLESLESLIALTDSMVEVFLKGGLLGRVGLKMLVRAARDDASRDTPPEAPNEEPVLMLEESR